MKLSKSKKVCYIVLLTCGLLAAIYTMIRTIRKEEITKKDIIKYEYQISKNISYQVFLKDNIIYDKAYLEEGLYYPRKLIDYINLNYDFEYKGSDVVPIQIEYQCVAKINGFNMQQNVKEIYWTKIYPLNDKKITKISDRELKVDEEFSVQLDSYIYFVNEATKELGINLEYEILFTMEGTLLAETPYGEVNQPFSFDIQSEFNNTCKFSKNGVDMLRNNITEEVTEVVPLNISVVVFYIGISVLFILGILFLLIFTRDYELNDIVLNSIKKIQREYGSRMVALQGNTIKSYDYIYDVNSIKDLIKVSDEIQKPILYEIDEQELVKDYKFFIHNGEEFYEYCALDSIITQS